MERLTEVENGTAMGNIIKVHHDKGTMDNNAAPNYCSNCGLKFDWNK